MSNASDEQFVRSRYASADVSRPTTKVPFWTLYADAQEVDVIGEGTSRESMWHDARRRLEPNPDAEVKGHPEDCQCPSCWDDARKATAAQVLANSRRGRRDHPDTVAAQPKPDAAGEATCTCTRGESGQIDYCPACEARIADDGMEADDWKRVAGGAIDIAHMSHEDDVNADMVFYLKRHFSAPRNPDLAEATQLDRQYLAGLQQGWQMANSGATQAEYQAIIDARRRDIREARNG